MDHAIERAVDAKLDNFITPKDQSMLAGCEVASNCGPMRHNLEEGGKVRGQVLDTIDGPLEESSSI
jgi:hypothetical protein